MDSAPCPKVSNTREFCGSCKKDGRREWDVWRGSAKMHVRGRRSRRGMCIRDVRRPGRWFPERGCILEHQIFRFAKMILRGRCSKAYDLASIYRGRRSTSDRWSGKIANRIGTRPSPPHSTFHFWRTSRRILSFLMPWPSKKWGSLAELLRFGCCQVQKMKMSRRLVSFLTLFLFNH